MSHYSNLHDLDREKSIERLNKENRERLEKIIKDAPDNQLETLIVLCSNAKKIKSFTKVIKELIKL
jgi:hypothetical protein